MPMENKKSAQLKKAQGVYKTGLRLSAILLTMIFTMYSLLQYIVREREYLKYQKWIGVAVLAAAAVYVLIAVFTDREELAGIRAFARRLLSFEQVILILILLWYLLGCAVRSRIDGEPLFKFNDNRLFMITLSFFLFFPFAELMGKYAKRALEWMIHFMMLIYTPIVAYCVYKYYRMELFTFPSGLSLDNDRISVSMRMGGNLNITAAAHLLLFGICLYMLLTQRRAVRIIYVPVTFVYFLAVIVSGSRTSFLALLFLIISTVFLFVWDLLQNRAKPARIAGALITAVVTVVIVLALQSVILRMFAKTYNEYMEKTYGSNTTDTVNEAVADQADDTANTVPRTSTSPASFNEAELLLKAHTSGERKTEHVQARAEEEPDEDREKGTRKMNDLSGRPQIWAECVKIMFSSPDHFLFGVSPCYVSSRLKKATGLGDAINHAHNGLLQVGVGIGFPGMILFLIFEISIIRRCLIILFKGKEALFRHCWILPVIIAGIMITELSEAMLFAMIRFNVPVFYIITVCCVRMCRQIGEGNAAWKK